MPFGATTLQVGLGRLSSRSGCFRWDVARSAPVANVYVLDRIRRVGGEVISPGSAQWREKGRKKSRKVGDAVPLGMKG
jgi:hypothetical protein